MSRLEFRHFEIRADKEGRRVTGTVVRYGDVADIAGMFKEVFTAGALRAEDVTLNAFHERSQLLARTGGGGLTLRDSATAMEFEAEIPDTTNGNDVLTLVRNRVLRGASVEMAVREDEWKDGGRQRIIRQADLYGVALVARPAYSDSEISAMRERWHTAVGWSPKRRDWEGSNSAYARRTRMVV